MSISTSRNGLLADAIDKVCAQTSRVEVLCSHPEERLSATDSMLYYVGTFPLAAGNNGKDECATRVIDQGQITVGATNINDKKSSFSNFGNVQQAFSRIHVTEHALVHDSGTSYAAPHVAGMIAAILSSLPSGQTMSPLEMKDKIIADAPGGVVDMKKFPNSNNRLIRFDASLRGTAAQPSASAS
ncbi:peptidase S8/S53 domain-containing protein [Mycena galericulata]|nr:peptidase S8/S53 domain-containing protein [Mycena galericulata]